jgi:hypothetical protein
VPRQVLGVGLQVMVEASVMEVALYHGDDPRMLVSSLVGLSVDALREWYVWEVPPSQVLEDCHSLTHARSCQMIEVALAHDAHFATGENAEVEHLLFAEQAIEAHVDNFPAEGVA